jgi:hypothetical protein
VDLAQTYRRVEDRSNHVGDQVADYLNRLGQQQDLASQAGVQPIRRSRPSQDPQVVPN